MLNGNHEFMLVSLLGGRSHITTNFGFLCDIIGDQSKNSQPYSRLRRSHGVLNMLGWGVLMPIGVIVARYFRQFDPIWFYAHTSIQSGGFILGLAGVICGLVLKDRIKADVPTHKSLGIVVLVLGGLQVGQILMHACKHGRCCY